MELTDAMRCAPTSRRFTGEPIAEDVIRSVLDNARFAPSGGNRQGWRVVVVRDGELRRAIRDLYLPAWRDYMEQTGGAQLLREPDAFDAARVRMVQRSDHYATHLDELPVHLLIGVRIADVLATDAQLARLSIVGGASIYPFVQNVLLGLRAEGLGAAFTTLLAPVEEQVRELLGLPDGVVLAGHISVGHRADPWPQRLARNPVGEFAFAERYGEPY
jgi:nitroreductase